MFGTTNKILRAFALSTICAGFTFASLPADAGQLTDLQSAVQRLSALEKENAMLKAQLEGRGDGASTVKTAVKTAVKNKQNKFDDLESDLPTTLFINDLAAMHVFDGMGNEFKPYQAISRAEYVAWLVRAHNALEPNQAKKIRFAPQLPQQFVDLPPTNPYYKYVQALANSGYSVGYEDHSFRPNQAITREEMIGMKVGVDMGKSISPDRYMMSYIWKFSDYKEVDNKFTGYLYQDYYVNNPPYGTNIQRAFGKIGSFKPKAPVLRNEAAATLWAFGQNANIFKTTAGHARQRTGS